MKRFDDFLESGIVKKRTPDKSRSGFLFGFLFDESAKDYAFLLELVKKIPINESNVNIVVKQCYDVIMQMVRGQMLLQGYHARGAGAHEAEVSYLVNLGFSEKDVEFVDQIRYFRNGMLYYGTIVDLEYAKKVVEFLERVYDRLKKEVKDE
ncbi:MAG: hypothetical protein KJ600_03820 [Nanoarchaeota archaeon]|nr:hypothetical protein [Nanoarchaeota archaeon]MBU1103655.1 hypothetical protein [Nanoarchaeota archaeon]